MSVKPIPEGYTSLTPFLCIDGTAAAIDFYTSVFGAKLGDPAEAYKIAAVDPRAPATHSVAFYCEDVSPGERDRRMAEWAKDNVGS